MKKNIIIAAFITTFAFAAEFNAQSIALSVTDSPGSNLVVIEAAFPSHFLGGVRVTEAELPATTEASCMAVTDFSSAVPMSRSRYRVSYDTVTGTYHFSFGVEREMKFTSEEMTVGCRVVRFVGDGNSDGRDFLLWQRGGSPNPARIAEDAKERASDAAFGDGSVRTVRYSIAGNN